MPSTYTTALGFEKQATGEHSDTWGDVLDTQLQLIEYAIQKRTTISTTGGTTVLTVTQGADNQSRALALDVSGALVSNAIIQVPSISKLYVVRNNTTGAFTLKFATSADIAGPGGIAVDQGATVVLWVDGTNVIAISLANVSSLGFFLLNSSNAILKGNREVATGLSDGATITMDVAAANVNKVTLGGNRTLVISNAAEGSWFELRIKQDGTGGRTLAWPGNFVWPNATSPVLSTGANAVDTIYGRYDATAAVWYVSYLNNFAAAAAVAATNITIGQNTQDVDLFILAGSPGVAVTLTVLISPGVVVSASSPATPALDMSGFVAGSNIAITMTGAYVQGCGGAGGNGGLAGGFSGNDPYGEQGKHGFPGGTAIRGPGTGRTVTINNTSGFIWGGGGGGGGGGATSSTTAGNIACGGGGGGGAGAGKAGQGAAADTATGNAQASNGVVGGIGRLGDFGAGGAEAHNSTNAGGAGGAGGTWGAAGANGGNPSSGTLTVTPGTGGAAGKAVDLNGGAVTISAPAGPNVKGAVA